MSEKTESCSTCSCHPEPTTAESEVLDVTGAARLLSVRTNVVYRLIEHGRIPCRKVGKQYRFRRSVLLDWISRNERSAA